MANRFWVGGTGAWNDNTNHWASVTNGTPGASLPTTIDDAYFDANSFKSTGQTVSITSTATCKSMNWTGALYNPTLSGTASILVYGSLTFIGGMTVSHTGSLKFYATTTGNTITFAGNVYGGLEVLINSSTGGWTLLDNITTSNNFTFLAGTLNAGTSTIKLTGASKTFAGGGATYNNVEFDGTPTTITGSNTFNDLKFTTGKTVNFTAGTTQTVTTLSGAGASGNLITIQSVTVGTPYTISKTSGSVNVVYWSIKDCTATGGATFNTTNCTNVSGNSGWNFITVFAKTLIAYCKANASVTRLAAFLKTLVANIKVSSNIKRNITKSLNANIKITAQFISGRAFAKVLTSFVKASGSFVKTMAFAKTLITNVKANSNLKRSITKGIKTTVKFISNIKRSTVKSLKTNVKSISNFTYVHITPPINFIDGSIAQIAFNGQSPSIIDPHYHSTGLSGQVDDLYVTGTFGTGTRYTGGQIKVWTGGTISVASSGSVPVTEVTYTVDKNYDSLTNMISSNTAEITVNSNAIALKANQTDLTTTNNNVTGVTTRISTAEASITAQAEQIVLKASQTDLTTISTNVSGINTNLTNNYSTTSAMNSAINLSANSITSTVSTTYATINSVNKKISVPMALTNSTALFSTGTGAGQTTPIAFVDSSAIQIDFDGVSAVTQTWSQYQAQNLTWAQFEAKYNSWAYLESGAIANPVFVSTASGKSSTLSITATINYGDHLHYDGVQAYVNGIAVPTTGSLLAYTNGTITIQGTSVVFTTKLTYAMDSYYNDIQTNLSYAQSSITLLSDDIDFKVDKNGIIAELNISPETILIKANKLDLSGLVTITNLATAGMTTINGANIITGSIKAESIDTTNLNAYKLSTVGSSTYGVIGHDITYGDGLFLYGPDGIGIKIFPSDLNTSSIMDPTGHSTVYLSPSKSWISQMTSPSNYSTVDCEEGDVHLLAMTSSSARADLWITPAGVGCSNGVTQNIVVGSLTFHFFQGIFTGAY